MHDDPSAWMDARRIDPRVDVEAFCSELLAREERPALIVDLSPFGARLERPYLGGPTPREIDLELEVPEVDEVIWARGEVCFDVVTQAAPGTFGGPFGLVRRTGLRLVRAAARDLRLLRDAVFELRRMRWLTECDLEEIDEDELIAAPPVRRIVVPPPPPAPEDGWLAMASCYARA
jgi:hypothetical protein